tara:strand:+ start:1695 stop:2588 length:894 start_codon:yes stop_codon:yes gene_type:complete
MKFEKAPFEIEPTKIEEKIRDPKFWLNQFPKLTISIDEGTLNSSDSLPKETLKSEERKLIKDGYFIFEDCHRESETAPLYACMKQCYENGALPIFASLFDEFWDLLSKHQNSIETLLDHEYALLPDIWAWVVDPKEGTSGWAPHRDKLFPVIREDGRPNSLTLWIPLSDATTENGCISILPASLDPNYPHKPDLQIPNLQDIRAIPAKKGSLLGWNQAIIHWGGRCSEWADEPRISLAFEVQRRDIAPFNTPLLNPKTRPSFKDRLKLIGKQILQYQHMYNLNETYEQLGKRLQIPA